MKHEKVSQPSTFWIVEFGNQSFRSYFVVCGRKHVNKCNFADENFPILNL